MPGYSPHTDSFSVKLSVIIPFSYREGDKQCLDRLRNTLACFRGRQGLEVVLFDTSPKRNSQSVKTVASVPGVRYFHQSQHSVFSPGKTRNLAVEKARGDYLFFCDADLLCPESLVEALLDYCNRLAATGSQAFAMFPCLYLSEKTTNAILTGQQPDYPLYRESYLKGELQHVDGIAVASSCLLFERQWFYKTGGFRGEFAGHGCEDFDLIHRLAAYYPAGVLPDDYSLDQKAQFPGDYQGFRRYFSYYSLPHLFEGHFLLHQWHKRPLTRLYHRRRKDNEALFADILNKPLPACAGVKSFASTKALPDYRPWIVTLIEQHGLDPDHYPGLFRWKQGVVRPSGTWQRKLRKLLLNPKQFFRDMRLR